MSATFIQSLAGRAVPAVLLLWLACSAPAAAGIPPDIEYPLDGTVFPRDIVSPTIRWTAGAEGGPWTVSVDTPERTNALSASAEEPRWTIPDAAWREWTAGFGGRQIVIRVTAADAAEDRVTVTLSPDEVGAPIFYREVILPSREALRDLSRMRWRVGTVSSRSVPVVLEKIPVCASCHSFTADGATLGMDVDHLNDKGGYAILPVAPETILSPDRVISLTDYRREEGEPTFGLLSQVSPDGRHVVSTLKDRCVFVLLPDLAFSQQFFPVKGILVSYDVAARTFKPLKGADDPQYVQSSPSWSPDGKHIVFARGLAYQPEVVPDRRGIRLSEEESTQFLAEHERYLFDLYRLEFNDGEGGVAKPLEGASGDGFSNFFAKYSPDGRWIVFCKARSFMLIQPDSELYIIPAEGGAPRRMRCNTGRMNSWHSWSPNGKWLVFSSKQNGPYTRLFLTHVDENGDSTPPVELDHLSSPELAANLPEFVNTRAEGMRSIRWELPDPDRTGRAAR